MSSPAIVVSDLSAEYRVRGAHAPVRALRGVSFEVPAGHILGVLGESGSGKTTLARILAGRLRRKGGDGFDIRITGGEATVGGVALRRLSRRQRNRLTFHTGFLEQDANARLSRTAVVQDLVAEPILARDKRYDLAAAGQRVAQVLAAVQLPASVGAQYPYELSDGQRQRVAIARSLVLGPTALIADEPTAGIDATVRESVVSVIGRLREDPAFAAVLISHDIAVLRQLDATVAVMHRGAIVGYGPIDTVFDRPEHPYVAKLAQALALGDA